MVRVVWDSSDSDDTKTENLQVSGTEPVLMQVLDSPIYFSYRSAGPWIKFPAGTRLLYDVVNPFVGDLYMKQADLTDSLIADVTWMVSGYVNEVNR